MDGPDLDARLERWIDQRTGNRVRQLRVELQAKRVVVHGYVGSYHVRQLALTAALEALTAAQLDHHKEVELQIEIGPLVLDRP